MPSKRESSSRVDYVPGPCPHRPSLLPIECLSEVFGLAVDLALGSSRRAEKMPELGHLEEIKVVTRYP